MDHSLKFPKSRRLKSRKIISTLFENGTKIKSYPVLGLWTFVEQPEADTEIKVAFSVSKKKFRSAVKRNRIKRVMREAYRTQQHLLPTFPFEKDGYIALMMIYIDSDLPKYSLMVKAVKKIIRKLSECYQVDM